MRPWTKVALGLLAFSGATANAYVSNYTVGFGPFVGGGAVSSGASVRHTSGYALSLERNFQVWDELSIGPRLEVANAFVSTREALDDGKSLATYDNRIVAAGFRISRPVGAEHTFAQGIYLSVVAGKGFSKLSIDDSTDTSFTQRLYGGIKGNYFAGELGGFVPLKGSFGINVALLGNVYEADQSGRSGSFTTDGVDANGKAFALAGEATPDNDDLDDRIVIKTWGAKVGLSLGF